MQAPEQANELYQDGEDDTKGGGNGASNAGGQDPKVARPLVHIGRGLTVQQR